jgi:hypothetical protein
MSKKGNEILERVLLLMNYDNKMTLNENINVIVEQKAPTGMGDSALTQALWLNKATDLSTKDFKDVWYFFLGKVASMNLQQLKDLSKQLADNGYRPITPGLYGFNKPSAGIANIVVENQIYALATIQYDKDKKSKTYFNPQTGKNESYAVKPNAPQYNLLSTQVDLRATNLNIKNKVPAQILKTIQQGPAKTKENKTCYFNNKQEGNRFRQYVNNVYPDIAKKLDLSTSGDFCNSYINKAYTYNLPQGSRYKTVGENYKANLKFNQIDPTNISREDLGFVGDKLDTQRDVNVQTQKAANQEKTFKMAQKNKELEDEENNKAMEESKKYNAWVEEQLKKYDFSTFPVPKDYQQGKPIYDVSIWTEPKTGRKFPIIGKTLKEIKEEIINEIEYNKSQKKIQGYIDNQELIKIFGQDKLSSALKNEDCMQDKLFEFLDGVLEGKPQKDGTVLGGYKMVNGQSKFITWPSNKPIPCVSEFWDKYGLAIQVGGAIAAAILIPGLGITGSAGVLLELAVDAGLNLYSLQKNIEAQDENAIKTDMAYLFLPFLMKTGPVVKFLENAEFGKKTITSVQNKLSGIPKNATKEQVDDILMSFLPEEKRVLSKLESPDIQSAIKQGTDQIMNNLKKGAKGSLGRKLANPLINIIVYGSPAVALVAKQISDSYKKKTGKTIKAEDEKLWQVALSFLKPEDQKLMADEFAKANPEVMNKVMDIISTGDLGVETKKSIKSIAQGNLSDEQFNTELKKISEKIKKLNEETAKKLNIEDEIDLISLDELVPDLEPIESNTTNQKQ